MKKMLGGKVWAAVIVALMATLLVWMGVLMGKYFFKSELTLDLSMMLEGEYSADGGEWKPIQPDQSIQEHFHHIVFRGKPLEETYTYSYLTIYSKNVWYSLKVGDEVWISYEYTEPPAEIIDLSPSETCPNTPGYWISTLDMSYWPEEAMNGTVPITLEIDYPYAFDAKFSDCFTISLGLENAIYMTFFFESLPWVLLFSLVCFFGIFFFPLCGFILGKVNFKYLTFGALCFFWGLYMIISNISDFLNMWVLDPVVCMMIVRLTSYLLMAAILLYFKSHMTLLVSRIIGNITLSLFFISIITVLILQQYAAIDLTATMPYVFGVIAVCAAVMVVLLCMEIKRNRHALIFLVSWSPLVVTLVLDILDRYLFLSEERFFNYGLMIIMVYQIIRIIFDLRRQYKEAIRYQQVQKELYEAKVGIMVSQIQPHFMYNALTSIAMMCQIDPDTAQEATITFAKYLRGNMDSLKQKKPIPFTQELEHLKKYLYIEKLRFADLLQIEYDIQATDFVLPQLSIQPLVENAVKHGVGMAENGGTVTIATRETDSSFEIIITDDGVGFDTAAPLKQDGRSHVGMENTRQRVKELCGGEIRVESTIGQGTTATIILPKEGQPHENTVSG